MGAPPTEYSDQAIYRRGDRIVPAGATDEVPRTAASFDTTPYRIEIEAEVRGERIALVRRRWYTGTGALAGVYQPAALLLVRLKPREPDGTLRWVILGETPVRPPESPRKKRKK
jgi:hypothetical protein